MFERDAMFGPQHDPRPMQMPHQIVLPIPNHAIAGDEIVHPTTHIDWVYLQKSEMIDHRANR